MSRILALTAVSAVVLVLALFGGAEAAGVSMPNERWVRPVIVDSLDAVMASDASEVHPHPGSPKKHIEPAYERVRPPQQHRRYASAWPVHPLDGSPFRPLYVSPRPLPRAVHAEPPAPERPTVLPPFLKPFRVVGSHWPAIPDEPCACAYAVSDVRLCTKWVAAPKYACIRGTPDKCYKYAAAPVSHTCPCVHADNHRKCYVWAPPGTRVENFTPKTAQPSVPSVPTPTQPQRPASQPKTISNVRVPTVQPKASQPSKPVPKMNPQHVVSPTPFKPSKPSKPSTAAATAAKAKNSARRKALDRELAKHLAQYRAAAKQFASKDAKRKNAAEAVRKQRTAARVAVQNAVKNIRPSQRNAAPTKPLALHTGAGKARVAVSLQHNDNARPKVPSSSSVLVPATEYDKDIFTRTLLGEAKHDDEAGQRAVAWTLINRARDALHRFPKTLADVCKQSGQFRTWSKPALTKTAMAVSRHSAEYKAMRAVAEEAIAGRSFDPTHGGHFYFYNGRVRPQWSARMNCGFRSKVHTFCAARN